MSSSQSILPKTQEKTATHASTVRADRRVVWEWNLRLLAMSVVSCVVLLSLLTGLYFWQSQRLAEGILGRAQTAAASGDLQEQARWLSRYLGLVPDDVDARIQLALALDDSVTSSTDLDNARRALSVALTECGTDPTLAEAKERVRAKLIERLLQKGPIWAMEAEKQVYALNASPNDPKATRWLAKAIVEQRKGTQSNRKTSPEGVELDYWQQLAQQPPGQVLIQAWQANPDDVELAGMLVGACLENPEWFVDAGQPPDPTQLEPIANTVVERLLPLENGRAQWITYVYYSNSNSTVALKQLDSAVEAALSRLAAHQAEIASVQKLQAESDKAKEKSLEGLATVDPDVSSGTYQPYWDWQIASESARLLAAENPQSARTRYSRLLACDSEAIPGQQRETTYAMYGSLLASLDGLPAAIELWNSAVNKLPESLELTSLLAKAYASNQDTEHALQFLGEYRRIIQMQNERLQGPIGAQLRLAAKQSIRQRLELAEWDAFLLHARIHMAKQDFQAASQEAQKAYASPLILTSEQRVQAGRLLAECYLQLSLWDMAGQTLDHCITLAPNDVPLRRAASAAWRNAGTAERTGQQLEQLDDGSFSSALEIAQLTDFAESAKPAELANPTTVTKAIQEARRRYEVAPDKSAALSNMWQLELLELKYAIVNNSSSNDSSKNSAEQRAQQQIERLIEIAGKYPDVSEVQMIAAAGLSQVGRSEEAEKAIARLEVVASKSKSSADQANLALVRANQKAGQNDIASGVTILREAIQQLPDQELHLAKAGTDIARRAKQPSLALEIMRAIKEEKLDTNGLMELASLSIALHTSAPQLVPSLEQDLSRWSERLKAIEGENNGTHWRYLEAQRMLLLARTQPEKASDYLNDAFKRFNEIDARRAHWGLAAALGGQIAAARGGSLYTEEAIALLQRALRDGDRQLSTVWILVKQLQKAGRLEEAERELHRAGLSSEPFLPLSAMKIDLAQGRGDFDKAVTVARSLVEAKSLEYTSWLVLSRTLLASMKRTNMADDVKQSLLKEAAAALEKAHELSQGNDLKVWNARFEFHLTTGDKKSAEQVVEALLKSKFPAEQKLLAAGRGYMQLKNFTSARKCFDDCLTINPKSALAYLALADLHNQMGDSQASLDALRRAHDADPSDTTVRERYVFNLAFGTSSDAPNKDQAKIDQLLDSIDSNSSARSRLIKAMIDLNKGNDQKKSDALLVMRELASSSTMEGADAQRLLANYYSSLWLSKTAISQTSSPSDLAASLTVQETQRNLNEAVSYYERLSNLQPPSGLDIARYAGFLLIAAKIEATAKDANAETHLVSVERLLGKLESISGSSLASLNLRLRLAEAKGEEDIQSVAQDWVQGAGELNASEQGRVWGLAGRTLADLGFWEDSLVWLEKAYQQDPSQYSVFVIALSKSKQVDRALDLSVAGYRSTPTAEAGTLIAEIAMLRSQSTQPANVEDSLLDAVAKFENSSSLLEAFATLRLLQGRYAESASGFEAAEKLAPNRVRTLNNYAIALSELPMGKELAITKIEKAIELHGRAPELLDTLGVVLGRNGKFDEAMKVLTEAANGLNDPRFQLHLAQVAYDQTDDQAAEQAWKKIDMTNLDMDTLNSEERLILARLQKQFDPPQ